MEVSQRNYLTVAALIVAFVAIARPLILERYDSEPSLVSSPLDDVSDPMPRRTLLLCAMVSIAFLFAARGIRDRGSASPYAESRLLATGFGLLLLASIVSCLFAGQKRIALNSSIDFLSAVLLAWIVACTFRQHRLRVLLVAGLLGVGAVEAVEAFEQYFWQFPDTWAEYHRIKETLWGRQGIPLDSATVTLFERRLQAREATGTMSHSNVAGSYFVMTGFLAAGVMLAGLRQRSTETGMRLLIFGAVTAALLGSALALTHSRGAMLSVPVAVLAWLFGASMRRRTSISRAKLVLLGWAATGLVAIGVVGYGLARDRLPGWSLTFRWHYWKTSAAMIADHPLTGVGRENFGRHYVRYKPAEYPEEVANPHNLFVQVAADLGVIGFIGAALLLIGGSVAMARAPSGTDPPEPAGRAPPLLVPSVLVTLAVTAGRLLSLGTPDANLLYYAGAKTVLVFGPAFAIALYLLHSVNARAFQRIAVAGSFGLLAAVVHDMIHFALFAQPTMTIFAAMAGLALSFTPAQADSEARSTPEDMCTASGADRRTRRRRAGGLLAFGVVWALAIGFEFARVFRSNSELLQARSLAADGAQRGDLAAAEHALEAFSRAARADSLDPTPLVERAGWLRQLASGGVRDAESRAAESIESLKAAIARDPHSTRLRRLLAASLLEEGERFGRTDLLKEAAEAARARVRLYPEGAGARAALGECLLTLGRKTGETGVLAEAEETLRFALELDERRLWADELRRMPASERKRIEDLAQEARELQERVDN